MIKNMEKINEKKRYKLQTGMEFVEKLNTDSPVIDSIIVFGSSIRDDCTEDSDIDLCIKSEYNDVFNETYYHIRGSLEKIMDERCDILRYNHLNAKFKDAIDKGVIIYEK
jgi:predicted nucleotidyltransferase